MNLIRGDFSRYSKKKYNSARVLIKFLSNAGFRAVVLYRIGNWLWQRKLYFLSGLTQRLMHHLCHCWISASAEIGHSLLIAHVGGIIIG
ncbi:MAG: hypothetical protein ACK4ON_10900, partial [Bacteroidia bacterium]